MAKSGGRRSLFWRVYSAVMAIMLIGAGAWAVARAAQDAVGSETEFRSTAGMMAWALVLAGSAFVVSMVAYGALLRYCTLTPEAGQRSDKPG
jgi:hypothetical protein